MKTEKTIRGRVRGVNYYSLHVGDWKLSELEMNPHSSRRPTSPPWREHYACIRIYKPLTVKDFITFISQPDTKPEVRCTATMVQRLEPSNENKLIVEVRNARDVP